MGRVDGLADGVIGLGCGGWDEMTFSGTVYLPHPMLYSKNCLRVEEQTRRRSNS